MTPITPYLGSEISFLATSPPHQARMKLRVNWFDLFYYSQFQLCLIAICLTASSTAVLVGEVVWECVVIVGLATYAIYSVDNIIDWPEDIARFGSLQLIQKAYRIWC